MKLKKIALIVVALAMLTVGQSAFANPSSPSNVKSRVQNIAQTQSTANIYATSPSESDLYLWSQWEDHNNLSVNYETVMTVPSVNSYVPTGSTINSATLYLYLRDGYAPVDPNMFVYTYSTSPSQDITNVNLPSTPGWVAIDMTTFIQYCVNSNLNSAIDYRFVLTGQAQGQDVNIIFDGPTGTNKPYLSVNYTP